MFGVALGGLIVIKLQTADGTLVVEVNEPGAKVTVLNEQGEVEIARASDGGTLKLSVDPGKHRLKVEKDGFAVFAKEFSIASGETESIKATLVPPQAVVSAASRQGNQGPIPAPPGLIAWWSGDGHADDYVGGNHGKLSGAATFAAGIVGEAFCLDGSGASCIRVPDSDALNPKAGFSIECWVQSACVGSRNIIGKWNMQTQDFSYFLQDNGWEDPSAHRFLFALSERSQMSSRFDLANLHGKRTIVPHMWVHVAATFDGTAARLYVNGLLDGTHAPATGRIHSGTADVVIGVITAENLNGQVGTPRCLIDELCLYDRALAPDEIEAIYRAAAAGKIKPERAAQMERAVGEASKDGRNK